MPYTLTDDKRYLDLINDYCVRWCEHIESFPPEGPIPCSILPEGAEFVEMNYAGIFKDTGKYQIFYATVAENTLFDIVVGFFNAYRLTENKRYLEAAEKMIGQFILNGDGVRPASRYTNGQWVSRKGRTEYDELVQVDFFHSGSMIPHLAVLHSQITGETKYMDLILNWAKDIDEVHNYNDQTCIGLLCAAHYFDGDPKWLDRAYQMALRAYPLSEGDDQYHQCNSTKRQGSKNTYLALYFSMVGGIDFATRGSLASQKLRYYTDGKLGLDKDIAIRVWMVEPDKFAYEAVNMGGKDLSFEAKSACGKDIGTVNVPASGTATGTFCFK